MIKHLDFSLVNEGKDTILLYRCENLLKDELENGSNHYNRILGLIPSALLEQEKGWELRYQLEDKVTLDQYFKDGLTKDKIVTIFFNVINRITIFQEEAVDLSKLVLNERYIYLDQQDQPYFIYVPIEADNFDTTTILQFFRDILSSFPFDEKDDLVFFVKLHNYLIQSEGNKNIIAMKEKIMELAGIEETANNTLVQDFEENAQFYSPTNYSVEAYSSMVGREETGKGGIPSDTVKANRGSVSPTSSSIQESGRDMGDESKGTTVLGTFDMEEEAGTTTLDDVSYVPHFILLSTNEKIKLTKSTFTIGRDPNNTDYTLFNKVVGRVHAKILSSDGVHYIKDNNSRNGTYVNGVKLEPMERVKMKHEDKIKLANEELEFRIF